MKQTRNVETPDRASLPRSRRGDLICTMRNGDQGKIARRLGLSRSYVSRVLNGLSNQHNDKGINVIRLAEQYSQRELGKRI
jgi:DNA-binding transcriptional regulator YdaS (Cro superfamily)